MSVVANPLAPLAANASDMTKIYRYRKSVNSLPPALLSPVERAL